MAKDLNLIYGFKILQPVKFNANHISILRDNPIRDKDDWKKSAFGDIKAEVKSAYYLPQNRRCAYCRKKLNADGYFNQLDHVIPRKHHKSWMFKPRNLVITCEVCNPLKNADNTLAPGYRKKRFPKKKAGFTIFNPHFDRWENCFEIEDSMFIRGKTTEGEETIRVCKLYQYNYCVQFIEEAGVNTSSSIKRATWRLRKFSPGTVEHESAKKVIDFYTKLI